MNETLPQELRDLEEGFLAGERDAEALVAGLTEAQGAWRAAPGTWSVSECLDHLATANRLYLDAMQAPAARARERGKLRRRAALPGWFGSWFVRSLEPKAAKKRPMKAPGKIRPQEAPPLGATYERFQRVQDELRAFLLANADLDLARIGFPNPFIPGLRFSLATGLHVLEAHNRRHLAQAWRVRRGLPSS